ncbi:MAG: hypothetical protein QMD65_01275 [Patescibacteria group bacterium]|nr:hypothetical protein [Patescibacteria group bacterium]
MNNHGLTSVVSFGIQASLARGAMTCHSTTGYLHPRAYARGFHKEAHKKRPLQLIEAVL